MFLHFDPMNRRKFKGPDFFLVLDTDDKERKSWVVWQEGMKFPDVIIELLSDTTRKTDKREKKELYEQVFRTWEYYIYDPFSHEFEGYRLADRKYVTVLPDKEKKIYSPMTGLYLIVKDNWLRWMTKDGYILPSPFELFEQEKKRAEEEKKRAEEEKKRAEEEKKRAEEEKKRAEEEKKGRRRKRKRRRRKRKRWRRKRKRRRKRRRKLTKKKKELIRRRRKPTKRKKEPTKRKKELTKKKKGLIRLKNI